MNKNKVFIFTALFAFFTIVSCRKNDQPASITEQTVTSGVLILNEGNFGNDNSSLSFYNYETATLINGIFQSSNPNSQGLGETGNDIGVYGTKAYIVMNGSNKVEVIDIFTFKRLKTININSGRYVVFHNENAYISAYGNSINTASANGTVTEIDTATLSVKRTLEVGRQPEEMEIVNQKLYVANSGGFDAANYERTVSVIDLNTFTFSKNIDVAINLDKIKKDNYGFLYVSSRGDYTPQNPSKLFIIDTQKDEVTQSMNIPVSDIAITGDSVYIVSTQYSFATQKTEITYHLINAKTKQALSTSFITDGTAENIIYPYSISVDENSRNIFIGDAKDFLSQGSVYIYDKNGKLLKSMVTGAAPRSIAFIKQRK